MQKRSFVRKISRLIRIQIAAMALLFCVIGILAYHIAVRDVKKDSESFLNLYGTQLENRLDGIERVMGIIIDNNTELEMIQSNDYLTRHYASVELKTELTNIMGIDTNAEAVVAAESRYGIYLTAGTAEGRARQELEKHAMELAETSSSMGGGWGADVIGGESYIYRSAVKENRALVLYVSAESLMNTGGISDWTQRQVYLCDEKGEIYGTAGTMAEMQDTAEEFDETDGMEMLTDIFYLLDGRFELHLYESRIKVYSRLISDMGIMLAAVALLYIFTLYLRRDVQRSLITPMNSLRKDMERIQAGEYELRVRADTDSEEFDLLADSFNRLLDEIIQLRIRYYEKRLELQEADQKYIRLQLRPHFFLNAMTTVSALSTQGKDKEIQKYISALTKNIRYMFSSGIHTVAVKEEIQHVKNYFEMQELKYPDCVFTYIELPKELENWRIPQMLIHTLVENEYKYAVSRDEVLMLLIRVSETICKNERMLLIEIEDNGEGYPGHVIEYINNENGKAPTDGTRVGLWSIRRLMELMYERKGLFQISNLEHGGAVSRIFVPENTVHEVKPDSTDEGIK